MCCTVGGVVRWRRIGSKIGEVALLHVSLIDVRTVTIFGLDRQGDHVVKLVGCDVDSAASVMLLSTALSAMYDALFEAATGVLKLSVTRHTSSRDGIEGTVWMAWFR